jgi:hypothetical protein
MGRGKSVGVHALGAALMAAAVCTVSPVQAASSGALTADEWQDCAGFYYLLADTARKSGKPENVEMYTGMAEQASLAARERAAADLERALTDLKAGRTADIPSSAGVGSDPEAMLRRHAAKAREQGAEPYIETYSAQCNAPVTARIKSRSAAARGK